MLRNLRASCSSGRAGAGRPRRTARLHATRGDPPTPSLCGRGAPTGEPTPSRGAESRRDALLQLAALLVGGLGAPSAALAGGATLSADAPPGDLIGRLARSLPVPLPEVLVQPEAVRFPRKPLQLNFAVLLMRSSYDAVDALDFLPMEQFEANFWKLRQSELEPYTNQYAPLKFRAGDLTDPLYFDFISFSQYATISREMQRGQQVFEERRDDCSRVGPDDPCETKKVVVKRRADLRDNAALPRAFFSLAGSKIYEGLLDGFRGERFEGTPQPPAKDASAQQLAAGMQALLDVMISRGYAIKAAVSVVEAAGSSGGASSSGRDAGCIRVEVEGPANLWALAALGSRRSWVSNTYDAMVVDAWLARGGYQGECEASLTDSGGLVEEWRVYRG